MDFGEKASSINFVGVRWTLNEYPVGQLSRKSSLLYSLFTACTIYQSRVFFRA